MKLTLKEILFLIDYLSNLALKTSDSLKRVQMIGVLRGLLEQLQKDAGKETVEYSVDEEFIVDISIVDLEYFITMEQLELSGEMAFVQAELINRVGEVNG